MAVEGQRGCGFRKVGGLYLVGSGRGIACDRLPIELSVCPCCGNGIKQSRGWTWVDIAALVGGDHYLDGGLDPESTGPVADKLYTPCKCPPGCPLCWNVKQMGKGGLLWIGAQFYATIEDFEREAGAQGISRRISAIPRGFKVGETWVLLAHPQGVMSKAAKAFVERGELMKSNEERWAPAIFRVWKPQRLERIYNESERGSEAVKADIEHGITPVFVPDNDPDHH